MWLPAFAVSVDVNGHNAVVLRQVRQYPRVNPSPEAAAVAVDQDDDIAAAPLGVMNAHAVGVEDLSCANDEPRTAVTKHRTAICHPRSPMFDLPASRSRPPLGQRLMTLPMRPRLTARGTGTNAWRSLPCSRSRGETPIIPLTSLVKLDSSNPRASV